MKIVNKIALIQWEKLWNKAALRNLRGFRLAQKWVEGSTELQERGAPTSASTLPNLQKPLDAATHPPEQSRIASKFVYERSCRKTGRCHVSAKAENPNSTNTEQHYPLSHFPL